MENNQADNSKTSGTSMQEAALPEENNCAHDKHSDISIFDDLPSMEITEITREIGIDMGHRVTNHGSKCKNIHGHRYRIVAHCEGMKTQEEGNGNPQEGMLVDFGFLKDEMMRFIDGMCDHGITLWRQDPLVVATLTNEQLEAVDDSIHKAGQALILRQEFWGKICVVPFVPTAENLAKWFYKLLKNRVWERSSGYASLYAVTVWETPNCSAVYENHVVYSPSKEMGVHHV
jgi:6-pyruvoyltetrahydropterin/6-carboxytetrahydropterin synthase